jgi:hypothetical protein
MDYFNITGVSPSDHQCVLQFLQDWQTFTFFSAPCLVILEMPCAPITLETCAFKKMFSLRFVKFDRWSESQFGEVIWVSSLLLGWTKVTSNFCLQIRVGEVCVYLSEFLDNVV